MRTIYILLLLLLTPFELFAEEIKIEVQGMVCSFCAQGIKRHFSKLPEVEEVKVDLDTQSVVLKTKDKQSLSDEKIKEIITDSGYDMLSIKRNQE